MSTPSQRELRTQRARKLFDAGLSVQDVRQLMHIDYGTLKDIRREWLRDRALPQDKELTPAPYRRGYVYGAGSV